MTEELEELFERQVRAWPQLANGIEGLAHAQTRQVKIDWFDILVRHIPHRVLSTTAAVDRESVAKRPCFLCAGNLPPEEEGLAFGADFTIYCNPFPIVDRHVTIAHREHRPQGIVNQFGNMLDLAAALPGYFVIYNGPECGASAPDHMHFQAGSRRLFPIATDTAGLTSGVVTNYRRNVFLLRGSERPALIDRMNRIIERLAEITSKPLEPMVNIAMFYERDEWVTYLFPRRKHRPEAFYTKELTVSPAAIDLCGIFVVPLTGDFEKITGEAIAGIFREVTLPDDQFEEAAVRSEIER
ncbi:MAG TPA: DUF4922 domain-containing protein [Candidatus Binataceae bacterium]|nr:DUF4922 domain-containing protein [Candidatus Binataceae bacterium]